MWVYVVDAGGARSRRLVRCGACIPWSRVSWSPDSSRIVFARRDGLHVVNRRTSVQRRVTRSGLDPAWSPSGSKIVFTRGPLYTVDARTARVAKLTAVSGRYPAWSPDGASVAFDGPDGMYVVGADGSDLKLILAGAPASGPGRPSWSADGERILFFNTPGTPGAFTAEIWTMSADGSNQRRLYASPCCVSLWSPPVWSPDGERIAFSADSAGGILLMDASGEHLRKLSDIPTEVAWQPIP
jgi:Tol biopolymer transport system component